jgi:RNA polymerase sigma factor (sigma-70 family)
MHPCHTAAEHLETEPRRGPAPTLVDQPEPPAPHQPSDRDRELVALVEGARAGQSRAWAALEARFNRPLRATARSCGLAPADVDETVQETWLDLVMSIDRIREPAALGGWLATVTRRNALRRHQVQTREYLTEDAGIECPTSSDGPEAAVLQAERRATLARAVAALPDRHRALMTLLLTQPQLSYDELSRLLSMPVGSIGPIRARALARLARDSRLCALAESSPTTLARWTYSPNGPTRIARGRPGMPEASASRPRVAATA